MRNYSKLSYDIWSGKTGKEVKKAGLAVRSVFSYLIVNRHVSMLGVYYLPIDYMAYDIGITVEVASQALEKLRELGFCCYDPETEYVWVYNMAYYQVGSNLKKSDKQIHQIHKIVASFPDGLPFMSEFYERYKDNFYLDPAKFKQKIKNLSTDATPSDGVDKQSSMMLQPHPMGKPSTEIVDNSKSKNQVTPSDGVDKQSSMMLQPHPMGKPSTEIVDNSKSKNQVTPSDGVDKQSSMMLQPHPMGKPSTEIVDNSKLKTQVTPSDGVVRQENELETKLSTPSYASNSNSSSSSNSSSNSNSKCNSSSIDKDNTVVLVNPDGLTSPALSPADLNSPSEVASPVVQKSSSTVEQIFRHWQIIMDHPQAQLDSKRKTLIKAALKSGYTADQLCEAITGCGHTPHNMGDNDRGQRYDGLHVILRNADNIDRFIHNCHCPPKIRSKADQLRESNMRAAQEWLKKSEAGDSNAWV